MPLDAASSTVSVYALSDALSRSQTQETILLSCAIAIVGILLIEERMLIFMIGAPSRFIRNGARWLSSLALSSSKK